MNSHQSGYVALISVLIVSIILLTITLGVSTQGFYLRSSVALFQYKMAGLAMAESCLAYIQAAQGLTYYPTLPISIALEQGSVCTIDSIVKERENRIIIISVLNGTTVTRLRVVMDSLYSVIDQREIE